MNQTNWNKSFLSIAVFVIASFVLGGVALAYTLVPCKHHDTELDSVSLNVDYPIGKLLAGYKTLADGNNIAHISLQPTDGKDATYWPITDGYVVQFFEHNNRPFALTSTGVSYLIKPSGLNESTLKFKPNSLLITSKPLIACTKIGWAKLDSKNTSNCYRVDGKWDANLYWTRQDVPPSICDGKLAVLISENKLRDWYVVTLNRHTGERLNTRHVKKPSIGACVCDLNSIHIGS